MENLSRQEIIKKTFDAMPRQFTSNEFVGKMIEFGADANKRYLYEYLPFLKNNCIQESRKTWRKTPPTMEEQVEAHKAQLKIIDTYSPTITLDKRIEEAISLLKANGYRVQKIMLQDV